MSSQIMALRIMMNPIEVFIPYRQMRRRMYALLHSPDTEDNVATPRKDEESGKGGGEVSTREVVGKDKWKKALTEWKKGELDKLSSVAIVAALVASVIASILAGSAILSWPVRALWLSALFFDLASLFTAVQETMMLTAISYDPDAVARLRHSLCHPLSHMPNDWPDAQERFVPHMLAVCFWNIAAILLTAAISLFVIGLNIWIFQAAVRGGDDKKIAVFFGVMATFVVAIYLMCYVVRFAAFGPRPPRAIDELKC
ncbi:uncharacterized protein K444DRAFT_664553 [Hyaloscypha bicolor E]|uniref:PGG domain-containing protein n=1 Tax=Hyaloscypha bicolor E TaxID=1095630 RepID=A0A2J6T657_9HELO|nr:uncharacterized protein K444DRAFT_664553 [Hyaloscypha bicolor E]PMD58502.1 hypothetical protein K444DRAFT_664553 [Hyaloscypha bicolor E]